MVEIKNSNRFGKLEQQVLDDFETNSNVKLPKDYNFFLIEHNGGEPNPSSNEIVGTDVRQIFGIHNGEYWANLDYHIKVFSKRIPSNTLPIAHDSGGNLFLLSLRKKTYGEIWFWDHENEAERNAKSYFDNITKVGNSFSDFIDNLTEFVDEDETEQEKIIRTNDIESLKKLINSDYDLNLKDEYNRTLIENASISNKIELVKILIDKGVDINNSLSLAKQNMEEFPTDGYEPLVEMLIKYKG